MKTLYIECAMGAAGDMLAAALLELLPDRAAFLEKMNGLGIPGVTVSAEKGVKCGVAGTHFSVKAAGIEEDENLHSHHHDHVHGSMEGHPRRMPADAGNSPRSGDRVPRLRGKRHRPVRPWDSPRSRAGYRTAP